MIRRPAFVALVSCGSTLASAEPAILAPPPGSVPIVSLAARGVQTYGCVSTEQGAAWGPAKPEAELTVPGGRAIGRHFAGPTWETQDGSRVTGSVIAQAAAPRGDAVAWLLVSAQATGSGLLDGTRYVLRRDTVGGEKPPGPCTTGDTLRVPYTATYTFYR